MGNSAFVLPSAITLPVAIANGGTGKTSASAAFGALSPLTTKGDLLSYDTANNRLPVGTDGYVVTADSTQTLGVKYAPPGSVLLAGPTSLAGSSNYTYTSLSSTYSRYIFMLQDVQMTTSNASMWVRMGPVGGIDSGSNYYRSTYGMATNGTLTGYATTSGIPEINQSAITVPTGGYLQYFAELYMPSSSFNYKILKSHAIMFTSTPTQITEMCVAGYKNTAAVTQIEFLPSTSTFSAGSISIYGMV